MMCMYCTCRIQIGDFVISSTKTPVTLIAHLENIPQDHDPMFTVANIFDHGSIVNYSNLLWGEEGGRERGRRDVQN